MRLGHRARLAVFLRSFAIQGSWNYRTLIGSGFAFALLPALRVLYRNRPERLQEAVERHSQLFNSHPYLAPMALGAVATLEAEGDDVRVVERFKAAVRGSLGTLGDRLVWAGWRPVCLLFALALLLAGAKWWMGVLAFLVLYNAGHLLLRVWAYRVGLRETKAVGERLRRSPIGTMQRVITVIGAFLVGLVLPMAVAGMHFRAGGIAAGDMLPVPWLVAAVAAAVLGTRLGARVRQPVVFSIWGIVLLGLLLRILP